MYPTQLRYTKDHEWVLVASGEGTVGITDFAQSQLGDIVYVELPEIGKTVAQGDVLGTIESVKAVSEVYAPVSGTVTATNPSLQESPESVNKDPHGAGWICKIRLSNPAEAEALLAAPDYEALARA